MNTRQTVLLPGNSDKKFELSEENQIVIWQNGRQLEKYFVKKEQQTTIPDEKYDKKKQT